MTDRYYSGLAVSLAARLISIVTSLVLIWAFNVVGREVYGSYAFASSVVAIFIVIGSFGMDQLVLYRQSQQRNEPLPGLLTASLGRVARISLVIAVLYVVLGYIQTEFREPAAEFVIYVALALTIPAVAGTHVFSAWHQAFQYFARALLVPRVTDLLRLLFIIPLALLMPDLDLYLLVIVISAWLPLLWYSVDNDALPPQQSGIGSADRRYARHMVMIRIIRSSVDNIGIIMVGLMTTPVLTAGFALATRIASFALLGNQLLAQITLPRLGASLGQADYITMMAEFERHRWLSMLVALVVVIIMVFFGPTILGMFGNYDDALPVLHVLLGANIIASGFGPVGNALKMGGHASRLLTSVWIFLILLFASSLLLIPLFGIIGAAYGALISILIVNLLNWWQCYRVYRIWTSGMLAFSVILASNIAIYLFASGMAVPGLVLLSLAVMIVLSRVLQTGQWLTKTIDC